MGRQKELRTAGILKKSLLSDIHSIDPGEKTQHGRKNRTAPSGSFLGLTNRANVQHFVERVREKQILLWNTDISKNYESLTMNSNKWFEARSKHPRVNYTIGDHLSVVPSKEAMEEFLATGNLKGRDYSLAHTSYRFSPASKWVETDGQDKNLLHSIYIWLSMRI